MAPPPSDPSYQTKKKGAPIKFLVPLIYAPALPLIRLALRHKPVLRDRLFTGVLAGAFAHGMFSRRTINGFWRVTEEKQLEWPQSLT